MRKLIFAHLSHEPRSVGVPKPVRPGVIDHGKYARHLLKNHKPCVRRPTGLAPNHARMNITVEKNPPQPLRRAHRPMPILTIKANKEIKLKFVTLCTAALATVALTACQSSYGTTSIQDNYNRGENVIRAHVGVGACLNCFNAYRGWADEKAFALSPSGSFSYARGMSSQREANQTALKNCQSRNGAAEANQPCKLLMSGHHFVWR